MRNPKLGEIVLFRCDDLSFKAINNGSNVCPAVVVRAWSPTCVNLRLINDGSPDNMIWKTSVTLQEEVDVESLYGSWRFADTVAV